MSDKFLNPTGNSNLTDGTADIFINRISINDAEIGKPLKINSQKQVIGGDLEITDINNLSNDLVNKTQLEFTEQLAGYTPPPNHQRLYFKTDEKLYKLNSNNVETEIGGGAGGGGVNFAITSDVVNNGIVFRNNTDINQIQDTDDFKLIEVLGNKLLSVPDIQLPSVFSVGESIVANTTKLSQISYNPIGTLTTIGGELVVDIIKNTNVNITATTGNIAMTTTAGQLLTTSSGDTNIRAINGDAYFSSAAGSTALQSDNASVGITAGTGVNVTATTGDIRTFTDGLLKIVDTVGTTGMTIDTQATQLNLMKTNTAWGRLSLTAGNNVLLQSNSYALQLEAFSDVSVFAQNGDLILNAGATVLCPNTPIVPFSVANKGYVDSKLLSKGTYAELLAKTGMVEGDQFYVNANAGTNFTSQENKLFIYSGRTWQVSGETIEMVCGQDLIIGNCLEIGTTADYQVLKAFATSSEKVIGVVVLQGATNGDWVTVATRGLWGVACISGTYDRGNYLKTDNIDGLAEETTSVTEQPFAKIVENRTSILNGTLIECLLHTQEIY